METLFASGHIVDAIALIMAIELIVLLAYKRISGRGIAPAQIICNAAAGLGLLLALRSALTGLPWPSTAAWLLAALCGHLADLKVRWQSQQSNQPNAGRIDGVQNL